MINNSCAADGSKAAVSGRSSSKHLYWVCDPSCHRVFLSVLNMHCVHLFGLAGFLLFVIILLACLCPFFSYCCQLGFNCECDYPWFYYDVGLG